jgi:hypothetical protein
MKYIIDDNLAFNGGICPKCGKYFKPNGVGPKKLENISTIIGMLPSSHILRRGASYHDWYYHIGGNDVDRYEADNLMLRINMTDIKNKCSLFTAWWYRICSRRNYDIVRKYGADYFGKDGCN